MRSRKLVSLFTVALLMSLSFALGAQAEQKTWNYMPSSETGTQSFIAQHPTRDGRGVAVAIFDTGVDAFAPGMLETSTGMTKLIEVRDFSTEGDHETAVALRDESGSDAAPVFATEDGLLLRGAEKLPVVPDGTEVGHPVYIGEIAEKKFINNQDVYDLNDDGDNTDRFGFIVFTADRAAVEKAVGIGKGYEMLMDLNDTARKTVAEERLSKRVWVVVVDTDGNGDLSDEKILRDYHVNYDAFALGSDNDPDSRSLMAWELNVIGNEDHLGKPEAPTVEFHFDDGSHGSHCAGIAAGHDVSGQETMDGGAPGAWVISYKLGDNRLAGGATRTSSMRKCYEAAAEFEKKFGIPVVVNMSFGIASVEEGEDSMGGWLDNMLVDNPTLYVCTSAGNEGPGLSTVGIPATCRSIISSGAYLSVDTGADLYSARMTRNTLFNFSSRGGETAKPDIVAPGSALSTVPGFIDGMARFNGTSMASPQTTGAVACLVSAAQQEGLDIHWGMMMRAIIAGATPVPGLALNDQGGGLVNTATSWEVLKKLAASKTAKQVLRYDIETPCVFQDDGLSDAAYWRTPGGVPAAPEKVTFTVHPVFHPDMTPDEKDNFFRSFRFKSEAPWLKLVSGDRYIRGDMGMTVAVKYDGKKLQEPGLYSARVIATLDGGDLGGLAGREFYLWNTVVVGDPVGPESGYMKVYEGKDLAQSCVQRHYVNVPAGATAMRVRLEVSKDTGASKGAAALVEICDPQGKVRGGWHGYARTQGNNIVDATVFPPELYPGTWELNVCGGVTVSDLADYRLTVSFDGYDVEPAVVEGFASQGPGKKAAGNVTITRSFSGTFKGRASANMLGFCGNEEVKIEEADEWTKSFTLDGTTPRAEFFLTMDEAIGNKFTDCAVNILDSNGKGVRATGFNGTEVRLGMSLPEGRESATYTLQVVGAFAIAEEMNEEWGFDLNEKYFFASPVSGGVKRAGGGRLTLPCGVPTDLKISFDEEWAGAPGEMSVFGKLQLRDSNTDDRRPGDEGGKLVLEVPLKVESR